MEIFLGILVLGFFIWLDHRSPRSHFIYAARNPYRRYCRKCGQQQDYYSWNVAQDHRGWWENQCTIADRNCSCHKWTK